MGQIVNKPKQKVSPRCHVQPDDDSTRGEYERPEKSKKQKNQKTRAKKTVLLNVSSRLFDNYDLYYRDKTWSRTPNLDFYRNRQPFQPNGVHIDELLTNWKHDYGRLERNHSYIQWLFPLQKPGRNPSAKPLTTDEIQIMKRDQEVMRRFLAAYKLMLGFYGIRLLDSETGKVTRAENWKERFHNLNVHEHNNLRITRILKCLGELGYDHFQAPLVRFFLEETLCNNNLPNVKSSVLKYFMSTVKDKQEHRKLEHFTSENCRSQKPFF